MTEKILYNKLDRNISHWILLYQTVKSVLNHQILLNHWIPIVRHQINRKRAMTIQPTIHQATSNFAQHTRNISHWILLNHWIPIVCYQINRKRAMTIQPTIHQTTSNCAQQTRGVSECIALYLGVSIKSNKLVQFSAQFARTRGEIHIETSRPALTKLYFHFLSP